MSVNALSERSGGVIGTIGPIGGKGVWSLKERGLLAQDFYDDVSLLLHCNGANGSTTFVDSSKHGHVVTANGNAQISTAQSKFGGASAAFDGNGDYLSTPNVASLRLGAGDFTCEAWIYLTRLTNTAAQGICGTYGFVSSADRGWLFFINSTGYLSLFLGGSSGAGFSLTSGTITEINTWTHVAAVRSGSTVKLYLGGAEVASGTSSKNEDYTVVDLNIGTYRGDNLSPATGNAQASFQGYIDDLRITKGRARYTPNFSPPTAAFPDDTNGDPHFNDVSLLLHMDGSNGSTTFTDSSSNAHTVTANGDAQISTAQSKFGGASAAFDGNGDYLSLVANSGLEFGTGDFTIEFWVRMNSTASLQLLFEPRTAANQVTPVVYMAAGGGVRFYVSGADRIQGAGIATNQWYHIAVSRSGGSTRMFIDGNQTGSIYADTNDYISVNTRIGIGWDNFSSLNGYIDDLRITKGVARYTGSFTPPQRQFRP